MEKTVHPEFRAAAFTCPHPECRTYATQEWQHLTTNEPTLVRLSKSLELPIPSETSISTCERCRRVAFWVDGKMVYPRFLPAPPAHEDLPGECRRDYEEARAVFAESPKASAALLRLVLEKLLIACGGQGKIDGMIKTLVANGLPQQIQQAMDVCRVIGNEAVHPGSIDLSDTPEIALKLFGLVNFIVQNQITQQKEIGALFEGLPEAKKDGIRQRDKR